MPSEFLEELKEWTKTLGSHLNALNITRDNIKKEFDLPGLKDQLLVLPEQIKKAQIIALGKKAELSELERGIKQYEAEISFEVNSEQGNNDKPKFSNENLRKAELIKRLGKDEGHRVLKKNYSAIEFKLWEFEAEVDRLRNEFKARLAIKDLVCSELNLYTK